MESQEHNLQLQPLRVAVSDALSTSASLASALDSGRRSAQDRLRAARAQRRGIGRLALIYQEVSGLRALGLDAYVALASRRAMPRARRAYPDANEVFRAYRGVDQLAEITARANVVAATHFKSAPLVLELRERRSDFLPAYYVQDYEPFFTVSGSPDLEEALASYTLIPECLLFAKTHWLCNIVAERHGIRVAKVEPSIDERVYRPSERLAGARSVRVAAMIRPRTPRRQPTATISALEQVSRALGSQVHVTTFGCPQSELARFTQYERILRGHRGVLSRVEVAELLGETDVFLDMSMYQAFGRTALEAMACGATAVVPRLGGVWEFVEHRENAIAIDPFDTQQAVDAIHDLIVDRQLLQRLQAGALDGIALHGPPGGAVRVPALRP